MVHLLQTVFSTDNVTHHYRELNYNYTLIELYYLIDLLNSNMNIELTFYSFVISQNAET